MIHGPSLTCGATRSMAAVCLAIIRMGRNVMARPAEREGSRWWAAGSRRQSEGGKQKRSNHAISSPEGDADGPDRRSA